MITMADRTETYNGETQYGWVREDEKKETVDGLVHNETVTIGYTPASGKDASETAYDNGSYDETTLTIMDGEENVTGNYNLKSATAGQRPPSTAVLPFSTAVRTETYNGVTQYGWAWTDETQKTVDGLKHNETVTIGYTPASRTEESRVGKESRSRGAT